MTTRTQKIIHKILKFYGSNLIGTLVDTLTLLFFAHVFKGWYIGTYIIAPAISFELSVLTNFAFSFFFIWKDRIKQKNPKRFFTKFLQYNLSCTGVFMVKMGFLLIIENFFGWHVVICNLFALCFSGVLNFFINEFVIFRKRNDNEPKDRLTQISDPSDFEEDDPDEPSAE